MNKQMEVTKKKIGEYTFYIRPFPAFVAANISGELSQVIAPMLGALSPLIGNADAAESGEEAGGILDMEIEDALPAFSDALSTLSGDKFEHLMRRLLVQYKNISVNGEATGGETEILDMDMANEIFCGEIQDMFLLCFEVVKVNFGGFFKKIAGRFGGLQGFSEALMTSKNMGS